MVDRHNTAYFWNHGKAKTLLQNAYTMDITTSLQKLSLSLDTTAAQIQDRRHVGAYLRAYMVRTLRVYNLLRNMSSKAVSRAE